jgi:hypothetical protein
MLKKFTVDNFKRYVEQGPFEDDMDAIDKKLKVAAGAVVACVGLFLVYIWIQG